MLSLRRRIIYNLLIRTERHINRLAFTVVDSVSFFLISIRCLNILDEHISSQEASVQAFKSGDRVSLLQFHDVVFPSSAKDGLVTLLGFDLKMKGMSRVKEITRHALEGKDDQIRKLADRIENLLIT